MPSMMNRGGVTRNHSAVASARCSEHDRREPFLGLGGGLSEVAALGDEVDDLVLGLVPAGQARVGDRLYDQHRRRLLESTEVLVRSTVLAVAAAAELAGVIERAVLDRVRSGSDFP